VVALLQAGPNASPVELHATVGVDMRGPEPLRAAFERLTTYIDYPSA
jgi:oligoendopeptidase F